VGFLAHFFLGKILFQHIVAIAMSFEIVQIIDSISSEKGIDRKILIDAIEAAVLSAAKKRYNPELELAVDFNDCSGEAGLFLLKDVVDTVQDPELQISVEEARKIDSKAKKGQKIVVGRDGRFAAIQDAVHQIPLCLPPRWR